MSQPKSQARRDDSEWVTHKETIRNLFLKENKYLRGADGVVETMERLYGFHKSPEEYERYLRKWNIRKNRNSREWEAVGRIVEARKAAGKFSVVRMNGEILSETKLNKRINRHSYTSSFRPYIQLPIPQIPMGFEVLTPRADGEDLLSREDTIPLSRVGDEGPVPTFNLPFMKFQAIIRLKESVAALPNSPANDIENRCLHPASRPAATDYIESGVQAEAPLIYNLEDTEVPHELVQTYYSTVFPKFRALLPISAQAKCSKNHPGMLPPLQSLTTAQVELLWFSVANNFAGLPDFPRENMWNYVREHISVSGLLQFSPGPTTIALAENLFQCIVECGDVQAAEFLLEKRYVNANKQVCIVNNYQYTPVERSAKLRNVPMTRLLVHYKADVNKTHVEHDYAAKGALEHAVSLFDDATEPPLDLIHILLESGASITVRVLERALYKLYLQVAEILIYKGAQDRHMEWTQRGIFLYALKQSDVDTATRIVEIMLRVKASIAHSVTVHHETLNGSLWKDFSPRSVLDMAAEQGYLEVVRILLDSGIRLTEETLTCAIRSTNMELVLYLLHEDVNVDTVATLFRSADKSGWRVLPSNSTFDYTLRTPYSEAIRSRNTQLIRLLKDKGVLRHIHQNSKFKAALFAAAEVGNLEIVRSLIRDVRGKEKELGCALFKACAAGHEKVAQTLITAGADANASPENPPDGNSSLAEALKRKMAGLVQLLLNTGADPNIMFHDRAQFGNRMSPLGIAVEQGDLSLIKDLLFAGARVNPEVYREVPVLSIAIRSKNTEVIQLLLDNGADINPRLGCDTPLVAAIESGVIEMVDWLLESGADPADEAALLRAMSQSIDLVQRLLQSFSKRYPYGKGEYGSEALSRAVRAQDLPLVRALLQANIGVVGNPLATHLFHGYKAPLVIAMEVNNQELVEMLLSKVADLNRPISYWGERRTALLVAVSVGNLQMIQLLISRGANLNLAAARGINRTPLQMAAEKGRLEVVQLLIEKGAEVNALPAMKGGATALQLAAIGGYIGIAEELLRRGARVNAPGSSICGRTALEGAAEHGRIDMVQYLLNAGAEITGSGYHQYAMAIQYAKENGHGAVCELLESAAESNGTVLQIE
ncbi:Ankyrin repeat-containing domain protein [Hyaloscypha variabilis]